MLGELGMRLGAPYMPCYDTEGSEAARTIRRQVEKDSGAPVDAASGPFPRWQKQTPGRSLSKHSPESRGGGGMAPRGPVGMPVIAAT